MRRPPSPKNAWLVPPLDVVAKEVIDRTLLDVPECLIRLPLSHIDLSLAKDLLKSSVSLLDVELFTHLEEQTLVSALLRLLIVANRQPLEAANDLHLVV